MPSNKTKFYIKLHFSVCLTVCYQELKKQSVYNLPEMEQIFSLYECDVCVCVYIYIYIYICACACACACDGGIRLIS